MRTELSANLRMLAEAKKNAYRRLSDDNEASILDTDDEPVQDNHDNHDEQERSYRCTFFIQYRSNRVNYNEDVECHENEVL